MECSTRGTESVRRYGKGGIGLMSRRRSCIQGVGEIVSISSLGKYVM